MMTDKAISDIIAAILLISIVTASMGIVGVMVTRDIVPTKIPHMNFEACIKGGTIYLYHTGGDSLNPKESDADFYINLLDLNKQIIKTIKLMPWSGDLWTVGQVRNVSTEMHPTMDPSIKYVQIIAKPVGGGENLIQWTQTGNCNGTPFSPGPGCLARAFADYSYIPDSPDSLKISFIDKSKYDDPSYPITAWEWNFGDGSVGNTPNPTHTYSKSGNYTVRLRVHNACGNDEFSHLIQVGTCLSSVTASIKTDPNPPESLTGTPLAVTFWDNSSISSGSTISNYEWDFGDGTTATGPGPHTRTYSYGIYYVRLVVTDECGNIGTDSKQVTVTSESDCTVSAAISPEPSSGRTPLQVTFYDNSTTTRGWINSWVWTFEDGSTSSGQGPYTRTYTNPGPGDKTYTIVLKVGNTCGATGTASTTVTVHPPCEEVITDFLYTVNSYNPLNITFIDNSTTAKDIKITNYLWDFGDGTTSTEKDPTHIYSDVKGYTVSLTVTNECESKDTETKTLAYNCYHTITPTAGTGGSISPSSPTSVICGANQTFTIASSACNNISDIIINNTLHLGQVKSPYIYNFTKVLSDQSINAQFTPITYYINATAGDNGTISPLGTVIPVTCGTSKTFTIAANSCYRIQSITIDNTTFNITTGTNTTTFDSIDKNHTIRAEFTGKTSNINTVVYPSGTGSITPAGPLTMACGSSKTFTIEPVGCYNITEVKVNGTVKCSGSQCTNPYYLTLSDIRYDQNIQANFSMNGPYYINGTAFRAYTNDDIIDIYEPLNQGISPLGLIPVNCGNNQYFSMSYPGYILTDVIIDGTSVGQINPSNPYFTSVTSNHSISAIYTTECEKVDGYVINQTTGSPVPNIRITLTNSDGTNPRYRYTRNDGYFIFPVTINSGKHMNIYCYNSPVWTSVYWRYCYKNNICTDMGPRDRPWVVNDFVINKGAKCGPTFWFEGILKTITPADFILNAAQKTAYIPSGGELSFTVQNPINSNCYITVAGVRFDFNAGDSIRIVSKSKQSSGYNLYMSKSGNNQQLTTCNFDMVELYLNNALIAEGPSGPVNIPNLTNFYSSLTLVMPENQNIWTSFTWGGTSIINGVDQNGLTIFNLSPNTNGVLNVNLNSLYVQGHGSKYSSP
ncbi:PKD domain-containing protein [Methanospirillum lacunae]|uniref:PKD domain-containing protein n=1 Tax=Methanospirillum lacunae TaxID=668570 RepID=A0A2V2MW13_9EURY|nr:PKD domain-containing protein [Methanospirillum lacunae]PWR72072.1 hypothetical protein DK846_08770 [Methanospirillum lacunae]